MDLWCPGPLLRCGQRPNTIARLAAQGIDAEPPTLPDGFWTSWLTDPDGYRIELVQWPAGHPDGLTEADMAGEAG